MLKAALIPLVMAALGLGLGAGAAVVLGRDAPAGEPDDHAKPDGHAAPDDRAKADDHAKPGDHAKPADHGKKVEHASDAGHGADEASGGPAFVPMRNSFVVPMLDEGRTYALVSITLSLQVEPGAQTAVVASEPKLRDALLGELFDHANTGGFSGDFTAEARLAALRGVLRESARAVAGEAVSDVLIQDIARQDV